MRCLEDIFQEAMSDKDAVSLDMFCHESRMLYNVKISKDRSSGKIIIQDSFSSGDYYKEISEDKYIFFMDFGWKVSVYMMAINNLDKRIYKIKKHIESEANSRNNESIIKGYSSSIDSLLSMQVKIKNKLNKLNKYDNI
jgi:hypothetical protein